MAILYYIYQNPGENYKNFLKASANLKAINGDYKISLNSDMYQNGILYTFSKNKNNSYLLVTSRGKKINEEMYYDGDTYSRGGGGELFRENLGSELGRGGADYWVNSKSNGDFRLPPGESSFLFKSKGEFPINLDITQNISDSKEYYNGAIKKYHNLIIMRTKDGNYQLKITYSIDNNKFTFINYDIFSKDLTPKLQKVGYIRYNFDYKSEDISKPSKIYSIEEIYTSKTYKALRK